MTIISAGPRRWLVAAVLLVPALAPPLISAPLMRRVRAFLPRMGDTERIALEAGTVWWDGELFSGKPDWPKLLAFKPQTLSDARAAVPRWPGRGAVPHDRRLAGGAGPRPAARGVGIHQGQWLFRHGHSGAATAASDFPPPPIRRSSSRSPAAASPRPASSWCPIRWGRPNFCCTTAPTEQRGHYLPRLARGEDIPCFALTEPHAGSDAAASRSTGIVCRGNHQGKEALGLRLTFDKRYITLAPVATVIGLAFNLHDPDGLLGGAAERGITCALIPRDTPGLEIGRRHDPMGVPFPNGPITGHDVFVPLDCIIGGASGVGQGWRMLMECLAAGRSISLPGTGGRPASQIAVRVDRRLCRGARAVRHGHRPLRGHRGAAGAHRRPCLPDGGGAHPHLRRRRCRRKAGRAVGHRQGLSHRAHARRDHRCHGHHRAGPASAAGPRNLLGRIYTAAPIAITVEGANILTRSLIVFGQGSIRCHPYRAPRDAGDGSRTTPRPSTRLLFRHLGFMCRNAARVVRHGADRRRSSAVPARPGGPLLPPADALFRRLCA